MRNSTLKATVIILAISCSSLANAATFETRDGSIQVSDWSIQRQGLEEDEFELVPEVLGNDHTHDFLVIEPSRFGSLDELFTETEVETINQQGFERRAVAAILDVAVAQDWREYWDAGWSFGGGAHDDLTLDSPAWLGEPVADDPEGRWVRFWDDEWKSMNREWTNAVADVGFDGLVVDLAEAQFYWAEVAPAASRLPLNDVASRATDFIAELLAAGRAANPDFFVVAKNADFLASDLGEQPAARQKLVESLGGVITEALFADSDSVAERAAALRENYQAHGVPVFALEVLDPKSPDFVQRRADLISSGTAHCIHTYAAPSDELDAAGDRLTIEFQAGDLLCDGNVDSNDIDFHQERIVSGDSSADLNGDGSLDLQDRIFLVESTLGTYVGDANLDGEFSSTDLVEVFSSGQYEDDEFGNSNWASGDWDGDGDFNSTDFVLAFRQAGYEQGPRAAAAAVPEPTDLLGLSLGLIWLGCRRSCIR